MKQEYIDRSATINGGSLDRLCARKVAQRIKGTQDMDSEDVARLTLGGAVLSHALDTALLGKSTQAQTFTGGQFAAAALAALREITGEMMDTADGLTVESGTREYATALMALQGIQIYNEVADSLFDSDADAEPATEGSDSHEQN